MTVLRQFIIAPSLARLIQKERGGEQVLEGYFPDQPQRRTYVQVKETRSSLILEAMEGAAAEEHTNQPPTHAQAPAGRQPGSGGVPARHALDRLTRDPGPSLRQARCP
jgi:hypothetical protein